MNGNQKNNGLRLRGASARARRKAAALMICLLMAGPGLFALASEKEDPAAVRVGGISYPLSVVQFAADPYLDLAEAAGETLSEQEQREIAQRTVDRFTALGVIENKLAEAGKNEFTEDEMDILRAEAAREYESTWQRIRQDLQNADETVTEEEITSWMEEKGYTREAFLRELMTAERENRILDLYCADVTVTEEEVQAYYRTNFLDPARERYEHDVPLYEKEIRMTGAESFYMPEGYRYLKNILLPFPEEIQRQLDAMRVRGRKLTAAVQKAYDALAETAAEGGDTAPMKEAYDQRLAALRAYEEQYLAKAREAVPMLRETIGAIREQLEAGISIETLLKEYSLDQQQTGSDKPGLLYHTDAGYWTEETRAAVDAMTRPGELSRPFADEQGVHLMYYVGDAPGGERKLTAAEEQELRQSALYAAQTEKLSGLIETWKEDYEIWTDASLIRFDIY